ncbi:hypothetical protein FRAHR75_200052 [Frankia sp. Hr75.2]|nr:hypothetical protein FRAHR75_200052 [Frankia sp. Hr75.2]SQE00367.1 hypothetical protein FMEAI12_6500053 [Parafrankia sp. Ea1.12]
MFQDTGVGHIFHGSLPSASEVTSIGPTRTPWCMHY